MSSFSPDQQKMENLINEEELSLFAKEIDLANSNTHKLKNLCNEEDEDKGKISNYKNQDWKNEVTKTNNLKRNKVKEENESTNRNFLGKLEKFDLGIQTSGSISKAEILNTPFIDVHKKLDLIIHLLNEMKNVEKGLREKQDINEDLNLNPNPNPNKEVCFKNGKNQKINIKEANLNAVKGIFNFEDDCSDNSNSNKMDYLNLNLNLNTPLNPNAPKLKSKKFIPPKIKRVLNDQSTTKIIFKTEPDPKEAIPRNMTKFKLGKENCPKFQFSPKGIISNFFQDLFTKISKDQINTIYIKNIRKEYKGAKIPSFNLHFDQAINERLKCILCLHDPFCILCKGESTIGFEEVYGNFFNPMPFPKNEIIEKKWFILHYKRIVWRLKLLECILGIPICSLNNVLIQLIKQYEKEFQKGHHSLFHNLILDNQLINQDVVLEITSISLQNNLYSIFLSDGEYIWPCSPLNELNNEFSSDFQIVRLIKSNLIYPGCKIILHGIDVEIKGPLNLIDICSLPTIKLTYNKISKANIYSKIIALKSDVPKLLSSLNPYGQSIKLIQGFVTTKYPLYFCINEGQSIIYKSLQFSYEELTKRYKKVEYEFMVHIRCYKSKGKCKIRINGSNLYEKVNLGTELLISNLKPIKSNSNPIEMEIVTSDHIIIQGNQLRNPKVMSINDLLAKLSFFSIKNPIEVQKFLHKTEIYFVGTFLKRKDNVLFFKIDSSIIICVMIHDPEFFKIETIDDSLKSVKVSFLTINKIYSMKSDFSAINEEKFVTIENIKSIDSKILTSISSKNTLFEISEIPPLYNSINSDSGKGNLVNKIYSYLYTKDNHKETKSYCSK